VRSFPILATGQGTPDFGHRRRQPNRGCERPDLAGRSLHGRGRGCRANSRVPGTQCTVLPRIDPVGRPQETCPSPGRPFGRVCESWQSRFFWSNASGRLGSSICVGFHCRILRYPRNAAVGEMVDGRVTRSSFRHACFRYGCAPVIISAQKEQILEWLSWGVEGGAIQFPAIAGTIPWPRVALRDVFFREKV
jgi:hypothetical protein